MVLAEGLHVFGDRLGGEEEAARNVEDTMRKLLQEKLGWREEAPDGLYCTLGGCSAIICPQAILRVRFQKSLE